MCVCLFFFYSVIGFLFTFPKGSMDGPKTAFLSQLTFYLSKGLKPPTSIELAVKKYIIFQGEFGGPFQTQAMVCVYRALRL